MFIFSANDQTSVKQFQMYVNPFSEVGVLHGRRPGAARSL